MTGRGGERVAVIAPGGELYTVFDADGSAIFTMRRENGLTPNGNPIGDAWVMRTAEDGAWIDYSPWRNDLLERVGVTKTTLGATDPSPRGGATEAGDATD